MFSVLYALGFFALENEAGVSQVADNSLGQLLHARRENFSATRAFTSFAADIGARNIPISNVDQREPAGRAMGVELAVPQNREVQLEAVHPMQGDQC